MKKKLMVLALLAGGSMFAQTRFSIGVNAGGYGRPYAPVSSYAYERPPRPGPDYVWVDGYYTHVRGRNFWVAGFWQRRPHQVYWRGRDFDRGYDRDFRYRDRDRDYDREYRFKGR